MGEFGQRAMFEIMSALPGGTLISNDRVVRNVNTVFEQEEPVGKRSKPTNSNKTKNVMELKKKDEKPVEKEFMFNKLPLGNDGKLIDSDEFTIHSPSNAVIISVPGGGKTDNMVNIPHLLIGDCEEGSKDFQANNRADMTRSNLDKDYVKIKSGAYIPAGVFETVDELNKANRMKDYWAMKIGLEDEKNMKEKEKRYNDLVAFINDIPFAIFAVDTITSLQELNLGAALAEYNSRISDPEKHKTNIKRVDEYGGVQYIRKNFNGMKEFIEKNAAPFIIYLGHTAEKKKVIKKAAEDVDAIDIALDGMYSNIFTAKAGTVGVLYRSNDGIMIDFRYRDESGIKARPRHLGNKLIKLADLHEYDDNGDIVKKGKTYWGHLYPELDFNGK